jgi:hypothetical protein
MFDNNIHYLIVSIVTVYSNFVDSLIFVILIFMVFICINKPPILQYTKKCKFNIISDIENIQTMNSSVNKHHVFVSYLEN